MKRKLLWIAVVILAVIVLFAVKLYYDAGEFKKIEPHCACACEKITGLKGAEDITVDRVTGIAFISAQDWHALMQERPARGGLYSINMNERNPKPKDIGAAFTKDLHPHGISLYRDAKGGLALFVVNHRADGNFIEIFEYRDGTLVHRESVSDPLMHSPNDVLAVGPRSFYVTNDHGARSSLGRTVEDYMQRAASYVLYFDGKEMKIVAGGIAYANGIAMSAEGAHVFVAATVGKCVNVYRRNAADGSLDLVSSIDVKSGPDNIELDGTGALWVASHPKMLSFIKAAKNPGTRAPSQVLKVEGAIGGRATVSEVLLDDGSLISTSSVAAPFGNRFLMGCVFDDHILLCASAGAGK